MMGVYIKGMEMPKSCEDCPMGFSVNFGILCTPTHNIVGDSEISKKQGFCPLVNVPPHGDLIDRKPFVEFIKTHWDSYDQWFVDQLEARPTIIPADPAEEGET